MFTRFKLPFDMNVLLQKNIAKLIFILSLLGFFHVLFISALES